MGARSIQSLIDSSRWPALPVDQCALIFALCPNDNLLQYRRRVSTNSQPRLPSSEDLPATPSHSTRTPPRAVGIGPIAIRLKYRKILSPLERRPRAEFNYAAESHGRIGSWNGIAMECDNETSDQIGSNPRLDPWISHLGRQSSSLFSILARLLALKLLFPTQITLHSFRS